MKTKEELKLLKEEYENLNKKLAELSEDELKQVSGGGDDGDKPTFPTCEKCGKSSPTVKLRYNNKYLCTLCLYEQR